MLPTSKFRPQQVIAERYQLIECIGAGGMGEVWSATHLLLKKKVAIKFLLSSLKLEEDDTNILLQRFKFEAQISSRLSEHTSHIITVHDAGVHNSSPFMVMEYIDGCTLSALIEKEGKLSPERFYQILLQIEKVLSLAHNNGIIHRDLKPSNIMLSGVSANVKLADFGIAKALIKDIPFDVPRKTTLGALMGSPVYMSPEQLSDLPIDHRVDLWALGIIAYEALTGTDPFYQSKSLPDIMVSILTKDLDRPSLSSTDIPGYLDAWFKKALAKKPDDRFQTIQEMTKAFKGCLMQREKTLDMTVPVELEMVKGLVRDVNKKKRWKFAGACAVVVLGISGVIIFHNSDAVAENSITTTPETITLQPEPVETIIEPSNPPTYIIPIEVTPKETSKSKKINKTKTEKKEVKVVDPSATL